MRNGTGLRLAALVCAVAMLAGGCAAFGGAGGGEVTAHFEDGRDYTFTGQNAEWMTSTLRSLGYNEEVTEEVDAPYTVDTADGTYRVNTFDGFVCKDGRRAWMASEQSAQARAILDWAYARLPKPTTTTTTAPPETSEPQNAVPESYKITNVPIIDQRAHFPSGCESTAAVMALRHAGVDITVADFVDKHLKKSFDFTYKDGQKYGPSPYEYFLGDPRSESAYGCMAPVIERALVSVLGGSDRVRVATGMTMEELCERYISNGIPVIVWATIEMTKATYTDSWILPDGSTYTWPNNEHCLVLTGYDDKRYYFNDPYSGRARSCLRDLGDQRYTDLGSQALVVLPGATR